MTGPSDVGRDTVEPFRARREALGSATTDLENSLAAPTATPEWRAGVGVAAEQLRGPLEAHIGLVDTEDGLSAAVEDQAPGLARPAERLAEEHADLSQRFGDFVAVLSDTATSPDAIRDAGMDLVGRVRRHLQQADDLFADASAPESGRVD